MRSSSDAVRYSPNALRAFACELLERVGVRGDIAMDVASVLLDGDLLGHTTHGLALLAPYLDDLSAGKMAKDGAPVVVHRRPAVERWDGQRLPGPWLTLRALDRAVEIARTHGTGTVVVSRSHHIACLAAYLKRATELGMVAIIQSSDPLVTAVAPHGGLRPFITPNPIAAGLPTSGEPILIDVSTSITSMGFCIQQSRAGNRLPGPWLIDHAGTPTDDPARLIDEPKGALLPLGGIDAGHKGFALALLVEALTAGLAGHGRPDPPDGWGATVFVQALDPEAFGGLAEFTRQMDFMADAVHSNPPRAGVDRPRLPGERGLQRYREQLEKGVLLYPTIMPSLEQWADKLGVGLPSGKS